MKKMTNQRSLPRHPAQDHYIIPVATITSHLDLECIDPVLPVTSFTLVHTPSGGYRATVRIGRDLHLRLLFYRPARVPQWLSRERGSR